MQNLDISKNARYTHATDVNMVLIYVLLMTDDNEKESIKTIENSKYCNGSFRNKRIECMSHMNEHGQEKSMFKRFEKVMSVIFTKSQMMVTFIIFHTIRDDIQPDYNCPKRLFIYLIQKLENQAEQKTPIRCLKNCL